MSTRRRAARVPIGSTAWLVASELLLCLLGDARDAHGQNAPTTAGIPGELFGARAAFSPGIERRLRARVMSCAVPPSLGA